MGELLISFNFFIYKIRIIIVLTPKCEEDAMSYYMPSSYKVPGT